jgi:hypothetical protein
MDGLSKIETRFEVRVEDSLLSELLVFLNAIDKDQSQNGFVEKSKEEESLVEYIDKKSLWYENLEFSIYLSEGAEQKVFFNAEKSKVIKFNDGIFYVNWTQYLESILIHNILFSGTSYELLGFIMINKKLFSVVQQDYIKPSEKTEIKDIQNIMYSKGFTLKRRNDYVHHDLGLIIEDLHEENVLVREGFHFFIDTVIYLK